MHRYAPYHLPSSLFSSDLHHSRPPTYRRSQSPPDVVYMSERSEVIMLSSPPSPPPTYMNAMPSEEVPPARAARALSSLHAALARAETELSRVARMREQQAGFVKTQMRLLDELNDEVIVLDAEISKKRAELEAVEEEIAKILHKGSLRSKQLRRAKQAWARNIQRNLRPMRTKSI